MERGGEGAQVPDKINLFTSTPLPFVPGNLFPSPHWEHLSADLIRPNLWLGEKLDFAQEQMLPVSSPSSALITTTNTRLFQRIKTTRGKVKDILKPGQRLTGGWLCLINSARLLLHCGLHSFTTQLPEVIPEEARTERTLHASSLEISEPKVYISSWME